MTRFAISKDLLSRLSRLDAAVRSRVEELAVKCEQMSMRELRESAGLHLEQYQAQRDPRARTIRLGSNHRGIVLVPDAAETIVLIDVLTHDDADRWMLSNEFQVNAATGALEVVDVAAQSDLIAMGQSDLIAMGQSEDPAAPAEAPLLFAHRSDREFVQLGVAESLLPLLRLMRSDSELEALLEHVPQGQADALIMLTGTESTDTLFAALVGQEGPGHVDPTDLDAAVDAAASQSQFHVVADEHELQEMLARPLAAWRVYLHPTQREAAYRSSYNGPVRITGGAGTGKTVVALHRVRALVERSAAAGSATGSGGGAPRILFTTFTRNLAQSIERDLQVLGGSDLRDAVEVLNIDRVAHQILSDAEGATPRVVVGDAVDRIVQAAIDDVGAELSVPFVIQEWEQVVIAQDIGSRDGYFAASRAGRGTRLDRRDRATVWKVIEAITGELARRGQRTVLQMAHAAAGYVSGAAVKPYDHIVVDEAQDLHEAQWRLIRAAVADGPDDLFIVGDAHQRIYDRRSSLSKVGINIRGRSRRLRINYRTTHEILRWSLAVLGDGDFDDLDTGTERQDRAGYHSFLHGPAPGVERFGTRAELAAGAAQRVRQWISDGVDPSEIALAARTRSQLNGVESELQRAGIRCFRLGRDLRIGEGVALGTMHRLKGLEYRCIGVVGVSADEVPSPQALAAVRGDPVEEALEMRRERCLLYVACTRAREDLWIGHTGDPSPFIAGA